MDTDHVISSFFIGLFIGMILLMIIFSTCNGVTILKDYKRGQIDALTGKIKYELVPMPDSTTQWKKIGK